MKYLKYILLSLLLLPMQIFAATADTELKLSLTGDVDSVFFLDINIWNPSEQSIVSVQSWLKYDKNILKCKGIETFDSAFEFVAPGENVCFDGIVKIGRSSVNGGVSSKSSNVAKVKFERLRDINTSISFDMISISKEGNVSVRVFDAGFPVNVLKEKPENFSIIGDSFGYDFGKGDMVTNTETGGSSYVSQLVRPSGVKLTSGPGYSVLKWNKVSGAVSYNLYYSQKTGRYLQKRIVGNRDDYYFDNLKTGAVYFYALTAIGSDGRESDFSDEVAVKIGYPKSSTSPLNLTFVQASIEGASKYVQTGPGLSLALAFLMAGLISLFLLRKQLTINIKQ